MVFHGVIFIRLAGWLVVNTFVRAGGALAWKNKIVIIFPVLQQGHCSTSKPINPDIRSLVWTF
jgi:hypothetical protein